MLRRLAGRSSSPARPSGIGAALARELAAAGRHRGAGGPPGRPARRGAGRLPRHLARLRRLGGRPLGPGRRRPTWPCEIWDHYGGLDVVVNNAAVPMRRHVTRLTMAEVERTMRINYFSPVAISLALLPRMLERGVRDDRQRVEPGRPAGHHGRGGLLRLEVRAGGLERVDGRRPRRDRRRRSSSSSRAPSTPRSGTSPTTTPRSTTGPRSRPRRSPPASSTPSTAIASSTTCPT